LILRASLIIKRHIEHILFTTQQKILLHSAVHDFVHDWAKSVKEGGFSEKPLWWLKSRRSSGERKNKKSKMVQLRPRAITVDRGSRGFGLSLIYRGLDKYEEKDTGIFVARVVPGGQAQRFGVREHDKILTINGKTPRNVDDAVGVIKQAGNQIKLVVLREEEGGGDVTTDGEGDRTSMSSRGEEINSSWMAQSLGPGGQPISRSGSARSFNTTFGRAHPGAPGTPSPRPARANLGQGVQQQPSLQQTAQQREFLRQQEEYKRQQQQAAEAQRQNEMVQHQLQAEQDRLAREREELQIQKEQIAREHQQRQQQQQQQQQQENVSVKDTVRGILESSKFGNDFGFERPKSAGSRVTEETKNLTENVTKTIERGGALRASTRSLHNLGLDNYPNPEMPESSRLTRKEEKSALQNLNNRLAGYIDRVRTLQNENHKLYHQVRTFEEYKTTEISNVKELYDTQLDELKKALENMNKNYNQLKVGAEGLLHENEDLKDKVKKKDTDLLNSMDRSNALEEELRNLGNRLSKTEDEHRRTQDQLRDVLPELESLRARLGDAKSTLDKEHLKSADLENKCEQLEEELKFKMSLLEKELIEVKHQKEVEISKIDGTLHDEYEDRLQKALQELRDIYDNKMQQNRDDFEKRYEDRIRELQSQLTQERGSTAGSVQAIKESRSRIEALISKVSDLEGANLALNQKIADMAQEMEDQRSNHRAQLAAKDDEIKRLLDELTNQMKEYQNLQEIKIALDMEIAVFRRLIESEEDRLDMDLSRGHGGMSHGSSNEGITVEKTRESSFQRKVTVSQTQL